MDARIRAALAQGHVIDITTTGRQSGEARRIEIVFHAVDGRIWISGIPTPGRTRAWIHNLASDPRMTFHLKGPVTADLPATARVVIDEAERRTVLAHVARAWNRDIETMVAHSPLIEVSIEGYEASAAA